MGCSEDEMRIGLEVSRTNVVSIQAMSESQAQARKKWRDARNGSQMVKVQ